MRNEPISIERFVADRFRAIGHPEADDAAIDAAIAEAAAYWRGRINAHLADDEEYEGEAADRGHR